MSDPRPLITDPAVVADVGVTAALADIQHRYDYIIVGGGTAGCLIANRLSENPNVSVLLIEAGVDNEDQVLSKVPMLFSKTFKTGLDWDYYTEPQPSADNRQLYWPRGKLLGGSSSINAMMFTSGAPSDYEQWVRIGAKGWGYDNISQYIRKMEGYVQNQNHPDTTYAHRGEKGSVITGYSYGTQIAKEFLRACANNGIDYVPDINTGTTSLGGTETITFIDNKGHRSSSATAFLDAKTVQRPNLRVLVQTTVTRVLFTSDSPPRAAGVELARGPDDPTRFRAAANKEVILCAGAINTPQLLLLSGVGPRDQLESLGIDVVVDQKNVGENLYDHLTAGPLIFRAKKGTCLDYLTVSQEAAGPALKEWMEKGTGPLTSNVGEAAAFYRATDTTRHNFTTKAHGLNSLEDSTSGPEAPDVEMVAGSLAFSKHGAVTAPAGTDAYSIVPCLLYPKSFGHLKLRSASPWDKPVIDPKYLSHPNDLRVLVRAVRLGLRIGRTEPLVSQLELKGHSTQKGDFWWPGDADPDVITDEEIEEYIRRNCETLYHPMGTAAIGPSASKGVVDPELRVYGTSDLRVMDASVFPKPMSGHPTSIIYAMAYRAADLILGKVSN